MIVQEDAVYLLLAELQGHELIIVSNMFAFTL